MVAIRASDSSQKKATEECGTQRFQKWGIIPFRKEDPLPELHLVSRIICSVSVPARACREVVEALFCFLFLFFLFNREDPGCCQSAALRLTSRASLLHKPHCSGDTVGLGWRWGQRLAGVKERSPAKAGPTPL